MNHLLHAACHILVSFAEALKTLFNDDIPDLEGILKQDTFLVELLPVVSLLTRQLKRYVNPVFLDEVAKSPQDT